MTVILKLVARTGRNLACLPLYWLGRLMPRRPDLWVFGAWHGHRYADNSRYLFEHVDRHAPDIRAVWISREPAIVAKVRRAGGEAHLAWSPPGLWLCARASLVVLTAALRDVNQVVTHGATVLQLWHGIPLKKIGWDDRITAHPDEPMSRRLLRRVWLTLFPFLREPCDYVISPSPEISPRFASSFSLAPERVVVTGYPRADAILDPEPQPVARVTHAARRHGASRIVGYIPTHRGEGGKGYGFDLFEGLDREQLQRCLSANDAILCIKMHFYHERHPPPLLADLARDPESRVVWIKGSEMNDVNTLLPHLDILITDYSSVFFDYLLLNRPILFTPFDRPRYESMERQLYEDYDSATPGPKCRSWEELVATLDRTFAGEDSYAAARRRKRDQCHVFLDRDNSARVTALGRAATTGTQPVNA